MHSESFKAGLIKAASDAGGDGAYIEGFLKEASVLGESIDFFINEAEKQSNDPEFRTKLAFELLPLLYGKEKAALYAPLFVKEAEGWLDDIGSYFNQGGEWVGTQLGNMFAEKGNQESMDKYKNMGSGILGGGVGALGGLLLGKGLNISPIAGALVGGLLGGAAGHFGNQGYLKKTTRLAAQAEEAKRLAEQAKRQAEQDQPVLKNQNKTFGATPHRYPQAPTQVPNVEANY